MSFIQGNHCQCGFSNYTETPQGGASLGGSAVVSFNREYTSGGAKCCGSATLSTNQVWDGYAVVLHLEEQGNGTTGEYKESAWRNNATGGGGKAIYCPTKIPSIYGFGQDYIKNNYITVPADNAEAPFTITCWVKRSARFYPRYVVSRGLTKNGEGWQMNLGYNEFNQATGAVQVATGSDWATYDVTSSTTLDDSCWYHLALVFDIDTLTLYVDGEAEDAVMVGYPLVPSTSGTQIGRLNNYGFHEGLLDEIRIYQGVWGQSRIQTEYANYCNPGFIGGVTAYEEYGVS